MRKVREVTGCMSELSSSIPSLHIRAALRLPMIQKSYFAMNLEHGLKIHN